jgi:UDP-N-acetylmuramate dehydrogenase
VDILENIPLAPLTTLQVGGPARYFVEARTEDDVCRTVAYARERNLPLFVLGGGSNLLIADSGWPGLVLKIAITSIEQRGPVFSASAGEDWDAFVARTVAAGCAGVECLSGIPGSVGGTPVQNVGAYGQEVSGTIAEVRVLDTVSGAVRSLDNAECGFSYRTSIFNSRERGRYIVLRVTFALAPGGKPRLEYADLKKYFAGRNAPTLAEIREAVRSIRRSKAMLIVPGDDDCRSAGSFFKNPVLTRTQYDRLLETTGAALPSFPAPDGNIKVAAAWLVEHAGFPKGFTRGPAGISRKHALAIINRGGARAAEIAALAAEIQHRVAENFGVHLEAEPVYVGF